MPASTANPSKGGGPNFILPFGIFFVIGAVFGVLLGLSMTALVRCLTKQRLKHVPRIKKIKAKKKGKEGKKGKKGREDKSGISSSSNMSSVSSAESAMSPKKSKGSGKKKGSKKKKDTGKKKGRAAKGEPSLHSPTSDCIPDMFCLSALSFPSSYTLSFTLCHIQISAL
ncbi:hypothetical protein WR25_07463 [Diploscapter pachys]|uniref:Uncharacterized protein n=1 Tax=Diploscapter pachys TaxID=2018661 RepID=A0A2A2JTC1_9BILA|nr:hypothetical protein WR25_07463 [Diploscapter pachys]